MPPPLAVPIPPSCHGRRVTVSVLETGTRAPALGPMGCRDERPAPLPTREGLERYVKLPRVSRKHRRGGAWGGDGAAKPTGT